MKSLKLKWSGPKSGKKKKYCSPKFINLFQAGLGSGQNFNFPYGLSQTRAETFISLSGLAGLRMLPYRPGKIQPVQTSNLN